MKDVKSTTGRGNSANLLEYVVQTTTQTELRKWTEEFRYYQHTSTLDSPPCKIRHTFTLCILQGGCLYTRTRLCEILHISTVCILQGGGSYAYSDRPGLLERSVAPDAARLSLVQLESDYGAVKKAVRDAEIAATALAKVPDAEVQLNALQVVLEAAQTQSTELGAKLERLGAQSKKLLKQYGMTGRGDSLDVLCQTMNEFRQQWLATELQLEQQVVAAEKKRKKAAKKEKQRAKAVAGGGTPRNSEDCEKRVRKSRKHK
jgi:hypothetical protein